MLHVRGRAVRLVLETRAVSQATAPAVSYGTVLAASAGLWRRRADLAAILGARRVLPPFAPAALADAVAGWGAKASGQRAERLSRGRTLHLLEDGFLAGHFGGRSTPAVSYILDGRATHYDGGRPSDLEATILGNALTEPQRERARGAIDDLRATRLTKYNDAPILDPSALGLDRPFVLLIEQVEGDLSLGGDGAAAFAAMAAEARARYPDHEIVVRPHPAARGRGPLERAAPGARILRERCNPWPLLEAASRVFTHSSHLGFEALMAGTPVTSFGRPFYAGWGLSEDRAELPRRGVERPIETVFHAAYIDHSRYLDLHDRTPISLERTIEALAALRDAQLRHQRPLATAGLSAWKRRAVAPFLTTLAAPPIHRSSLERARSAERDVAVWGAEAEGDVRLEDGLVRSVGLGAALRMPLSLVAARDARLPFDARGPNVVERSLVERPPDAARRARAAALVERIVEAGVTKYMLAGDAAPLPHDERLKVLVVGQVEDDASIRYGAGGTRTNTALLAAVRALFPDALIAYRDHPDVARGLRPGRADRRHVDIAVDDQPITALLDWCDRVETITSGTGFEALLRGVPVGTHGRPFYAGWGLTDDRMAVEPRGRATLTELAAAALIDVPAYIHPESRLPCSPERAVDAIAKPARPTAAERFIVHPAGLALGRLKHLAGQQAR